MSSVMKFLDTYGDRWSPLRSGVEALASGDAADARPEAGAVGPVADLDGGPGPVGGDPRLTAEPEGHRSASGGVGEGQRQAAPSPV